MTFDQIIGPDGLPVAEDDLRPVFLGVFKKGIPGDDAEIPRHVEIFGDLVGKPDGIDLLVRPSSPFGKDIHGDGEFLEARGVDIDIDLGRPRCGDRQKKQDQQPREDFLPFTFFFHSCRISFYPPITAGPTRGSGSRSPSRSPGTIPAAGAGGGPSSAPVGPSCRNIPAPIFFRRSSR